MERDAENLGIELQLNDDIVHDIQMQDADKLDDNQDALSQTSSDVPLATRLQKMLTANCEKVAAKKVATKRPPEKKPAKTPFGPITRSNPQKRVDPDFESGSKFPGSFKEKAKSKAVQQETTLPMNKRKKPEPLLADAKKTKLALKNRKKISTI